MLFVQEIGNHPIVFRRPVKGFDGEALPKFQCRFAIVFGHYGIALWLPQILKGFGGMSDVRVGMLSAVPFLTAAIVMVIVAKRSDSTGERRWHLALSAFAGAIALAGPDGGLACRRVDSQVAFKRLSELEIAAYLRSGEWQGKAGGYAIQGRAAMLIRWMRGSYSNVVGLPLFETAQLLAGRGYRPPWLATC